MFGYFYKSNTESISTLEYNDKFLSNTEEQIYNQIINAINNYETTIIPNIIIKIDSLNSIMNTIFNDHPEFFYLETSYSYKYSNDIIIQIHLVYNELIHDVDHHKKIFDNKVDSILEKAYELNTDLEKEKYIHDYLIEHVSYDENSKVNQSAYSALIYGSSVCAGYSRAFQYLMNQLEIDTYYCSGFSFGNHAWNLIYINNEFYNVDVTWNDSNNTDVFFNRKDDFFFKTHTRSETCKLLPRSE